MKLHEIPIHLLIDNSIKYDNKTTNHYTVNETLFFIVFMYLYLYNDNLSLRLKDKNFF